jgi:ankyrin repeat protein
MKSKMLTILMAMALSIIGFSQPQADLFSSCLKGDLSGVKKAVDAGADVNIPDAKSGQNALAYAYFSPEITKYLLDKGCDPNGGNFPAVISASTVGSYEVMKLLLDKGADPNKTALSMNALTQVVKMTNCAECAELLLSKGADKNATESIYGNAFGVFAANGLNQNERKDAMKKYGDMLKGYGLAVPDWYYNPSVKLNAAPDEMVKALLKHGVDINKRGTNVTDAKLPGETPLFIALNVGKQEIIMSLLNNGADYNATHLPIQKGIILWSVEGSYTPLMYACVLGYTDVVKWLSSKSDLVNVSVKGNSITESKTIIKIEGLSAIYLAIINGDMEIVKAVAETPLTWEDLVISALPGQKFEGSYGSKDKVYEFAVTKKNALKYTPSLFADFLKLKDISDYLKSKGL